MKDEQALQDLSIYLGDPALKMPIAYVHDKDAARLNGLIDEMLVGDEDEPKKPNKFFRASFVSTEPCKRAIVLSTLYPKQGKVITPREAAIFDDGDWRHLRIQEWARKLERRGTAQLFGIEKEYEWPKYWLSGHIDVVAKFLVEPLQRLGRTILELKGKRSDLFQALTSPERAHWLQAMLYCYMEKSHWAFIVYENKDTQERKIFKMKYDPKVVATILKMMLKLKVHRESFVTHWRESKKPEPGDLPRQEIAAWCSKCPWKKPCFGWQERGI